MIQESPIKFNSDNKNHRKNFSNRKINPITPSPRYQHFMSQISIILANQKEQYATEMAFNMSQPVIRGIATNSFPTPSVNFIKKAGSSSTLSVPTGCPSVLEDLPKVFTVEREVATTPTTTTTTTTTTSNAKLKRKRKLLELKIDAFKKECLLLDILDPPKLKDLDLQVVKILDALMACDRIIHYQHAESIVISVLLFSCEIIGMSKKNFLKAAQKISSKKACKLSSIRKAKCFAQIKQVLSSSMLI